jgi:hypothetical protein
LHLLNLLGLGFGAAVSFHFRTRLLIGLFLRLGLLLNFLHRSFDRHFLNLFLLDGLLNLLLLGRLLGGIQDSRDLRV